jgi:hypothetical protein
MCDNIKKLEALLAQSLDESVLNIVSRGNVSEEEDCSTQDEFSQEDDSDPEDDLESVAESKPSSNEPQIIVFDHPMKNSDSTFTKAEKRAFLVRLMID